MLQPTLLPGTNEAMLVGLFVGPVIMVAMLLIGVSGRSTGLQPLMSATATV